MEETKYYLVKVKEKFVDVETSKVKLYEGCVFEWKITSVAESPIDEIL